MDKKLKAHYEAVASLNCLVCRNEGLGASTAELHHPHGRVGKKEFQVIPLCYSHHNSGLKNPFVVSVHPWVKEFTKRYGSQDELLAQVDKLLAEEK